MADEHINKKQKLAEENSCPIPGYHYFGHLPRFMKFEGETPIYTTAVREKKGTNFKIYRDLICR